MDAKGLANIIPPRIPSAADLQHGGVEDAKNFSETVILMKRVQEMRRPSIGDAIGAAELDIVSVVIGNVAVVMGLIGQASGVSGPFHQ